jgi:3-oxoacyl-[acyl-carrier protein] reductase
VVTGASSGLGLGTAKALAADGASVVMIARSQERLNVARDGLGDNVHTLVGDVSNIAQVPELMANAAELLGGIDILVANAGGPPPGNFENTDIEAYLPALNLNLLSTVAMCKAVVHDMCDRSWGRIIAITSVTVRQPSPNLILSNTARAGLTGFLKTLAGEVAYRGVTVNSLQPGLHRTARLMSLYESPDEMAINIPARALGDPDDFGRVAAFLCSTSARFITGAAIPVDGGAYSGLQ